MSDDDSKAPPGKRDSPFQKLLDAYGASLHRWMIRLGVRGVDIDDATQEVLFELWQHRDEIPTDEGKARDELSRIVANVARRGKREKERHPLCEQDAELVDPRNIEDWAAAHTLWIKAARRLDEQSRDLIIAHKLEGRTFVEIANALGENEDTIRMRVLAANEKLRKELRRLLHKSKKRNGSSGEFLGALLMFKPFDRAVLRAMLEADGHVSPSTSFSKSRSIASTSNFLVGMPMNLFVGMLVMLPVETPNTAPLRAVKYFNAPLPEVVVTVTQPVPDKPVSPLPVPTELPREVRSAKPLPTLDKSTIAALRRLQGQNVR